MNYIITEKQYNLIYESNKLSQSINKLIDYYLVTKKEECEKNSEPDDEFLCEFLEMIQNIKVHDIKDLEKNPTIYLIFDYLSHSEPELSDFYKI
jgi:hypothetical protein